MRDVMHFGVIACSGDAPLSEIAGTMASQRVHSVVVTTEEGESLWGVISDLDLVAAASVRDVDEQTAGATAASPVVVIAPADTLLRAAQLMTEHASAHLVVVDPRSGRPLGIVSTLDLAGALALR